MTLRAYVITLLLQIPLFFYGQTNQQVDLPKYLTQDEVNMIQQGFSTQSQGQPVTFGGPNSCIGNCGDQAPGGCWCDANCVTYGDCCADYQTECAGGSGGSNWPLPSSFTVPGEFEEVQAVLIRWGWNTNQTKLYVDLSDAIQQEAEVWILVGSAADTNTIHNHMASYGKSLTNHKFLIAPTNSIWVRDYGPWGFYHGSNDSLAMVDMQYYASRPFDNAIPQFIADYMDIPIHTSSIYQEGGNLMVDGFGHAYHSSGSYDRNPGWTQQAVRDTLERILDLHGQTVVDRLLCDGGTGHIDMYAKLLDDYRILVTEYPSVVTASDRQRIEDNVAVFESQITTYNENLKVERIGMPRRNDGTYSTSCNQINNDARGFVNGLFVNNTYIMPAYSSAFSGDVAGDSAAVQRYRELLPGYNIVPIDARPLTTQGGAIHCITMQIPAENPVRFWHPPITDMQAFLPEFNILSQITNRSGIETATCYWRIKGSSSWNTIPLTDSAGYFTATIQNNFTVNDTIEYYLFARSNNQKEMTRPITAPDGFYTFYFDDNIVYEYDAAVTEIIEPSTAVCNDVINPIIEITNYGNRLLDSVQIVYGIAGSTQQMTWYGNLMPGSSTSVNLSQVNLPAVGDYTFTAYTSLPNGEIDENTSNDTMHLEFFKGLTVDLTVITDCWGDEVTWNFEDSLQQIVFSGGVYPNLAGGGTYLHSICLRAGCYTFNIFDGYGDGMHGSQYGSCNVDGDYYLLDNNGDLLFEMTAPNADYGYGTSHSFCIEDSDCSPSIYRTVSSGAWSNELNWESSCDGINFYPATAAPSSDEQVTVIIQNNHQITLDVLYNTASENEIFIESDASLSMADALSDFHFSTLDISGEMTMNHLNFLPTGDITVQNEGIYEHAVDGNSIPAISWEAGSVFLLSGIVNNSSTLNGINQQFSNFIINCNLDSGFDFYLDGTNTEVLQTLTLAGSGNGRIIQQSQELQTGSVHLIDGIYEKANNENILFVREDWITENALFIPANGEVIFNGSYSSNIISVYGETLNFNKLVLEKDGNSYNLIVTADIDILEMLLIESGKMYFEQSESKAGNVNIISSDSELILENGSVLEVSN
ncbi:MAG: hypothetical protein EA412_08580 [Chitinophagaceae bacterium]|nr:MAG: hypothetical protein EA412_08580 [Chitinophagaceae bacterium]